MSKHTKFMIHNNIKGGSFEKPFPADFNLIYTVINDVRNIEKVREVRRLIKEGAPDEVIKQAKEKLPALLCAQAMSGDGTRCNANVVPSDIVELDLDHLDVDPVLIHVNKVAPHIAELGIVLVQRSVREKGLHIWAKRNPGETIIDAQRRIANVIGVDAFVDEKCKDSSHPIFLTAPDDTYYWGKEEDFVFATEDEARQVADTFTAINNNQSYTPQTAKNAKTAQTTVPDNVAYTAAENWHTEYAGVPITRIIDDYLNVMGSKFTVPGTRNDTYFRLACAMKYVMAGDANALLATLPAMDLSVAERNSAIKSALKYGLDEGKKPADLQAILDNYRFNNVQGDTETKSVINPILPKSPLPEQLQILTRNLPDYYLVPVIFGVMPANGTLATDIRFCDTLGDTQSLSFLAFCAGEPASGKHRVTQAVDAVIAPLRERDKEYYARQNAYKKALKSYKEWGIGEIPTEPSGYLRITSDITSRARLLYRISEAKGEHILQINTEFAESIAAMRRDMGPSVQLYNKAFHNETASSDYFSEDTYSGCTEVYLNVSSTGATECIEWFIAQHDTGLDSRWLISGVPKPFGAKKMKVKQYTDTELIRLAEISTELMQKKGTIYCPWINEAADKWREEKRILAIRTHSITIDYFMNRDTLLLQRMGYVLSLLYGCELYSPIQNAVNADAQKAATDWAIYLADCLLEQQLKYFSVSIETAKQKKYTPARCPDVYAALPDEFDYDQLVNECKRQNSAYQKQITKLTGPWIQQHLLEEVAKHQYRKIISQS